MSFWDLVQDYVDKWGARESAIMRRAGLNKGTFTAWRQRGIPALPTHRQLIGLADALHVSYETLVDVILRDLGYLPESAARKLVAGSDESAGISAAEQRWGPEVHRRVTELLRIHGSDVAAAVGDAESKAAKSSDQRDVNFLEYLRAIHDGQVSFVMFEEEGGDEGDAGGAPATREPDSGPDEPSSSGLRALPTAASKNTSEPSVNKRRRRQDEAAETNQDDGDFEPR